MTRPTTAAGGSPATPSTAVVPAPAAEGQISLRRKVVLGLAGVTAATEVAVIADRLDLLPIGALAISPSILPGLLLALACGDRLLGRSSSTRAALAFWIAVGLVLPGLAVVYVQTGRASVFVSLVAAALGEELVYRLAIPTVIATALRLGNVRVPVARAVGFGAASFIFVLLPGHLDQMSGALGPAPFVAFAVLSSLVVYRSGSVLPMAAVHAISNLLAVLLWREVVTASGRGLVLACLLALMVLAYGRPRRITVADDGSLLDTHTGLRVVTIDLRDGREPTVELEDGQVVPVPADSAGVRQLLLEGVAPPGPVVPDQRPSVKFSQ